MAIAVAYRTDVALVVIVVQSPIIRPAVLIQVFLTLAWHMIIVIEGAVIIGLLVILFFLMQ
jgi:hypothetical protein